jgi:hypothetical protein
LLHDGGVGVGDDEDDFVEELDELVLEAEVEVVIEAVTGPIQEHALETSAAKPPQPLAYVGKTCDPPFVYVAQNAAAAAVECSRPRRQLSRRERG